MEKDNADLQCCICISIYAAPVTLLCGHSFCYECIYQHFKKRSRKSKCPLCSAKIKFLPKHTSVALKSLIERHVKIYQELQNDYTERNSRGSSLLLGAMNKSTNQRRFRPYDENESLSSDLSVGDISDDSMDSSTSSFSGEIRHYSRSFSESDSMSFSSFEFFRDYASDISTRSNISLDENSRFRNIIVLDSDETNEMKVEPTPDRDYETIEDLSSTSSLERFQNYASDVSERSDILLDQNSRPRNVIVLDSEESNEMSVGARDYYSFSDSDSTCRFLL